MDRPDPGGPVSNHECVIAEGLADAAFSTATTRS